MGSGMFPVARDSRVGKGLTSACVLLTEAIEEFQDDIYNGDSDGECDNRVEDGAALALLCLARKLIRDQVVE